MNTVDSTVDTVKRARWSCPRCSYSKRVTCKDGTRVCGDCGYYPETAHRKGNQS